MRTSRTGGSCGEASCGCGGGVLARREFLKWAGLTAAGLGAGGLPVAAGPFTRKDFDSLVPADKKLSPEWVRALFERGQPTVYRGKELEKIGMPVGGICAGQVYLGGDGRLWHWDVFNQAIATGAEHYARPMRVASPLEQGFALRLRVDGRDEVRVMGAGGWSAVSFCGQYPVGQVAYRQQDLPVEVDLEAFSPFIPLNVEDSSFPATVMRFTVRNRGTQRLEAELGGWLENAVCLKSAADRPVLRWNRVVRGGTATIIECGAAEPPAGMEAGPREDIVFDDFERADYGGWKAEGTAFGRGPVRREEVPDYQGDLGVNGERGVNSHAAAPGRDVGEKDAQSGTLTSAPFVIERHYIHFLIGGGSHQGRTCLNLLVDGQVVRTATGANANRMRRQSWDVRAWAGRKAQLQAVDAERGGWGNIGFDDIRFSDRPVRPPGALAEEADFGTMALALLEPQSGDEAISGLAGERLPETLFSGQGVGEAETRVMAGERALRGALIRRMKLEPGQSASATFVIAWHFPNLRIERLPRGRHYATQFGSARAVAETLAGRCEDLRRQTLLWRDTWYDSTLPHWFLERTLANASILASSTCHRLTGGRFWAWEGVGCCHGTCGHVWQYAHSMARLFPSLERRVREEVDFGLAQRADGAIHFRGEFNNIPAIDGQAGTILRALREHQMSADGQWLRRHWRAIRKAVEWLIAQDGDGDGLIEGAQHNTLDTDWHGPVAWLSGLYLAALEAAAEMATEAGDAAFAAQCRAIRERGTRNLVERLFDGEYFINRPDPKKPEAINSGTGCHIDQVMGQSWAFQAGLGRVLPKRETVSALRALWRYNFTPDVGPYRAAYKQGRWYAMAGEGGLLMCTFPREGWDYAQAKGKGADWAAGYFNECMNGFEYQVAGHMIWEGLVMEGLAITRMVHDRYHALRRNPWNEIECGDHYARSMASHGVYLAACGYEYHGPRGRIAFAPRLTPERFRCAFTAAEGWGTFGQEASDTEQKAWLEVKWGRLRVERVGLAAGRRWSRGSVKHGAEVLPARLEEREGGVEVVLERPAMVAAGERLEVVLV